MEEGGFRDLIWSLCTSPDPGTCLEEFFDFMDLDGRWQIGAATSAAYSGGGCTLWHAEGSVDLLEDGRVQLEIKEWRDYFTGAESECTLDRAETFSAEATCDAHTLIVAAPI